MIVASFKCLSFPYRMAYKWWLEALNCILQVKDALQSWGSIFGSSKGSIVCSKPLLERCGIWGCVLAGVIAAKIGRYACFAYFHLSQQAICNYILATCNLSVDCLLVILIECFISIQCFSCLVISFINEKQKVNSKDVGIHLFL